MDQPSARRDEIAEAMWDDYQRILRERMEDGSVEEEDSAEDEEEEEDDAEDESDASEMSIS